MHEHASRSTAALYDQFEDEHRVADWGGDELFTRMPRPPAVDDAPAPRFRPSLVASEPATRASDPATCGSEPAARASEPATRASDPAARGSDSAAPTSAVPASPLALVAPSEKRRHVPVAAEWGGARNRPRLPRSAEQALRQRAERSDLSVVEPVHRWDESGATIESGPAGRKTKVITGHPGGTPRPLPTVRVERRRPSRTPAEWIGPRPERIVAWAFVLGLLLILIAISTADAATP